MRWPLLKARARAALVGLGLATDGGTWIEPDRVLAGAYPRREADLAALAGQGITLLVNLHQRAHDPARLARHGLTELHLPVADFTPPPPPVIERALAALERAAAGQGVAVHCGAGLGRTGTVLACYLVRGGLDAEAALARVRAARPGSVETAAQEAAVRAYAERHRRGEGEPAGAEAP
jgi:atypical dual specificity phosphatase